MLGCGYVPETAFPHVLKVQTHVDKSFLVGSVIAGYSDFMAPDIRKAFHVFVLHIGQLLRFLCLVNGGFVMDGRDNIIGVGDYCLY